MPAGPGLSLRPRLRDPSTRLTATFVLVPRVEIVETLAAAGFDAVVFDLEHGPYDVPELSPLVAAAHGAGAAALVRVSELSETAIGRALDAGADGVIVPHVGGPEEAAAAVAAARFPPDGTRSVNPYVRGAGHGWSASYLADAAAGVAVMVMVEGAAGVAAAAEIVAVPGVDGVFVGPVDLAGAIGRPGQPEHADVVAAVGELLRQAGAAGVAPAVYAPTPAAARRWLGLGARFVALSADIAMAGDAFGRYLKEVTVMEP
ncbi:HpcH/HpaI aldolase family protein [Jiangella asiatica]|uniref:HpcH/HpaI aldolase/citrate lyase domain-containing protein n=1 Tax=Jiangella asiatica TaxID=2530372 RepID=A0A4R5DD44_9ACTN|nr:aldolase/citrate lyase family protein [Jiangella asiatica]TDE09910.1 hypothetical protein E1269_13120 [Jiangella asiatica]